MSLLKSKFFLGALVAVVAVFGFSTVSNAAYMHSTTLKMGMTSSQVMELQKTLNMTSCKVAASGTGSMGMESMYFGGLTKAAVMCFQTANALVADGVVGAYTGGKLQNVTGGVTTGTPGCPTGALFNSMTGASCTNTTSLPTGCTSTSGYSTVNGVKCDSSTSTPSTNGPLTGGAGSITVDGNSDFTSEEVGEAEEEVEVLGFEVEADDESDVEITSVKVMFELTGGTGSDKFDDYADSVQVWMGSKMVGEADVEDFSENSDEYSKSISLDGAIVRKGDTEDFSVSVTAVNNLDSGDINDDEWTADLENVRFEDAEGVVTTEDTAGDADQTFDFTDFASAADLEVKISLSDEDEINDAHVINVDASDNTDNVEVLSFEVEADGDSDVLVNELPIVITTVGTHVSDAMSRVTLWADGEELDSISTEDDDTSDDLVFEDLDFTIDAGDTVVFTISVDINDLDATGGHEVADGDTIQVSVGADAAWDIEDETGESVGTADITGTAAADAHGIYDVGIMAAFDRATATATPSGVATVDDTGTFKIYFDVTAFDSDIYVDGTIIADETGGATYQDIDASTTSVAAGVIECSSCETAANSTFKVKEGQTREFVVTIAGSGADVFASASLTSILYATTPIDGDTLYTFNMTDYKTDSVWLDSN